MNQHELLIRQLEGGPELLRGLIASIPTPRLAFEFGGDIWTVHAHVQHLALTQIMLQKRIQLLIKEEHPVIVPYQPDKDAEKGAGSLKPVPALLDIYASWRGRQVDTLRKAAAAVWEKHVTHPEYETCDFHIAIRHILLHDGFHFYRIEELGLLKTENVKALSPVAVE
jgi:hypothetical protein